MRTAMILLVFFQAISLSVDRSARAQSSAPKSGEGHELNQRLMALKPEEGEAVDLPALNALIEEHRRTREVAPSWGQSGVDETKLARTSSSLEGDELELIRVISHRLLAAQRQERAALDTPSMRSLREELRKLDESLSSVALASAAGSLRIRGQAPGIVPPNSTLTRKRRARRDRQRTQVSRVRAQANVADAEIEAKIPPKWRGQLERAIRKARYIGQSVKDLESMPLRDRRRKTESLRKTINRIVFPEQEREGIPKIDPTIQSITSHRRNWVTQP